MTSRAKLFKSGGSQAVRLPKECCFEGQEEVLVRRDGDRVILEPVRVMKIYKLSLTKSTLESIPEAERTLFVLLGHISNELNMLNKLLPWSSSPSRTEEPESLAIIMRAMFLARILAGKLNEAYLLLDKSFWGTGLSRSYSSALPEFARIAAQKIRRYFSRPNVIHSVRNEYAFHYSLEAVREGIALLNVVIPFFVKATAQ